MNKNWPSIPRAVIDFCRHHLPWRFLSILLGKLNRDHALFMARGLAFDVLFCLVPAVFLLFLLFGFLFDSSRETIHYMSTYMKSMIPFASQQVLRNLFAVVKNQKFLGVIGAIGMIWTLSRVFGSIRTVLDTVMEVKERRGALRGKLFDGKMMLVGSLFLMATVFVTSASSVLKSVSPPIFKTKFLYLGVRGELGSLSLAFFFTVCLFFFLYRFVPYRRMPTKAALYAGLTASILWELAKQVFRFYLINLADLSKIYGSFALLFALVLWVYYSCIIFILGAETGWVWSQRKLPGRKGER